MNQLDHDTLRRLIETGVVLLVAIGFAAAGSSGLNDLLCTFVLEGFKSFSIEDELEFPSENVKDRAVDLSLIFTTLQVGPGGTFFVPNNTCFQRVFRRRAGHHTSGLAGQLRQLKPTPDQP